MCISNNPNCGYFLSSYHGTVCVEGGTICRTKPKTTIFENKQFSGHFVFYKNNVFWREKQLFYPQELFFLEKKTFFFFFEKKMFFLEMFFQKHFFQNFKNISAHKKFVKFFFNFFEKKFPKKKHFFFDWFFPTDTNR